MATTAAATTYSSSTAQIPSLSPAELSYLHTSLSYPHNPIRTDGRSATQFRPLTAETDILPGANGSARIGFADGTQAIVGVKAEVERTVVGGVLDREGGDVVGVEGEGEGDGEGGGKVGGKGRGRGGESSWVEMSIEIPGLRDDDALPVFLAEMMREALMVSGSGEADGLGGEGMPQGLKGRLVINGGWHWRIYIDILLLSPPLSYPLPLLSLTTHLALLSTKLPRLISKDEEDPMFDDDWAAAEYLYPRRPSQPKQQQQQKKSTSTTPHLHPFRPPVTLLVISVGDNIIFDPSREEIAVAEAVLAVSVGRDTTTENQNQSHKGTTTSNPLKLLSIRTIDPPSRLTNPGIPNSENAATIGFAAGGPGGVGVGESETGPSMTMAGAAVDTGEDVAGVWRPRRGGVKRRVVSRIVEMVLKKGGVGEEVMEGLEGVEVG
ncbi:exosome complex component RRP42 [Blastomyces parvus]|uniref:Ribosomal RNA-processing protein 42 n=1 Tax=Blastomyces parvus TaxID=2060905 RepID=A0A2B7WMB1_9EURO|nr:exosome complex component RRP42 [Blastomyces parvus]